MLYIIVYLPRAIHCSCQQVVLPKIGNDAWCPTKDNLSKLEKRHRLLRFRYSSHDSFPRAGMDMQRWKGLARSGKGSLHIRCGRINTACAIDSNNNTGIYIVYVELTHALNRVVISGCG